METFKRFNAHPKGKIVGDCVKRAICVALSKDYAIVSLELNRYKKQTGQKIFNDKRNWEKYLKDNGCEKLSFPAIKGQSRMNGYSFCEKFPKGKYILQMAKHLTCCVDGVIYDTWDCREKCVYIAYRVEK